MNKYETALFLVFLPLYFTAFGLYHFMIFSVNSRLSISERIPHSLFWRGWNRVKDEYNNLHPKSYMYQLTLTCAITVVLVATALVALRFWEYAHGRLPWVLHTEHSGSKLPHSKLCCQRRSGSAHEFFLLVAHPITLARDAPDKFKRVGL